jgi:PAS domain S-box-containing protein
MTDLGASAKLQAAFELSPTILAVTSLDDGRLLEVNDAFLRATGYARDEVIGRSIPELGLWKNPEMREQGLAALRQGRPVRDMEARFTTKHGAELIAIASADLIVVDGRPCVLTALIDVTARQRTERFLAEASRVLTSSLDYAATLQSLARLAVPEIADWCGVHVVEADGAIECVAIANVDPAREALVRDLMARYPLRPTSKYGVPAVLRTGRSVLRQEVPAELITAFAQTPAEAAMLRSFRLRSVMIVPLIARGRTLGTITFFTAGTDRRYDERDLVVAEDLASRAALAVDNARLYADAEDRRREAEIIADLARLSNASLEADNVLSGVADAARALTHCDVARIALWETGETALVYRYAVGQRSDHAGLRMVKGSGLASAAVASGRPQRTENIQVDARVREEVRAFARTEGTFAVMVVPITVQNRVEGVIYCGRRRQQPFTERDEAVALRIAEHAAIALRNAELFRREQHARAEAESANRGKDDFLAVLSHELRTPLQAMLGWLRLMRAGRLDAAATAKALETIERNTLTQTKLIGDLLDVSGILAGKLRVEPRVIDLTAVVEAALQSVRAAALAKTIVLTSTLDPGPMLLDADPDRVDQVLANLLSNALKFTPAGGAIEVRLSRDGDAARLVIEDSGIGIAPEILPNVFDRFRQADSSTTRTHGGLGLGLALVRYLVEAHGGSVRAESEGAGRGATFIIALPLRATAPRPRAAGDGAPTAELTGARVLVVEDDADTRDFLGFALQSAGVKPALAATAAEALHRLAAETFDVVVSDLSMPDADGYALIRRLRELDAATGARRPAVALTAHAGPDDRRRALEAGFDAYLVKPVDARDLTGVVARLLRG